MAGGSPEFVLLMGWVHKLALLDDLVPEMPEWFQLRLLPSERYQIKNNQISVEILNDDFQGMLLSESFDYESGPVTDVSSGKWKHTSGNSSEMNIFAGQLDSPLTEQGIKDAKSLGEKSEFLILETPIQSSLFAQLGPDR